MAEKTRYPQIPSTVWWGVRSVLQRTPNATVDERLLAVQLGVQEAAARTYVTELKLVKILDDDGKATPLGRKWRLDETYPEAVNELIGAVYPEQLVHLAPPGEAERQKVVSWFQHEGLGQGAAGNKAATYLLLSSPTPNEAPRAAPKNGGGDASSSKRAPRKLVSRPTPPNTPPTPADDGQGRANPTIKGRPEAFPLNVNVQIHISADAGTEQIESIFQAMRRYLYDAPTA
ncbi:DUF5343 domain-containing protein [Sphingomonas sp. SUN019]|uniref:DUF5343 domain-containing protein n=1 Tax=Sphingomonas sp. SUN019 TaxID=2937788 RepID=UPI00216447DA|nr:DUF5343 domain-containing protein [Sphingomonas sp. SUN019]UVO49253.1 DUF5343 domain-containing protein [Sphingomonas sp. SUN019]